MATSTELILRFTGDQRQLRQTIVAVRTDLSQLANLQGSISQASARQVRQEQQTAISLQRQRSSAFIAEFRKEEQEAIRSAKGAANTVASLQRQRSAALIAEWKREQSEAARSEAAKLRAFQQTINQINRDEEKRIAGTVRSANARLREEQRAAREAQRITTQTARQAEQQERIRERAAKTLADVQIREARRAARELEQSFRQQAQATQSAGGRSSLLLGAVGGITALVGLSAANEIRQAASAWLDYSSKLETTRIAFTTMLGSAEAAEAHLKELQAFALKTPFQFRELIDASQRMQALGFRAEQVVPILNDVGNAVAAAGGGSERLDRVVLALSQIQSKGRVMTQELNQLAESGIPAFKILQENLGKSRAEVVKLVETGAISSKVFLDAFQKFSKANFGGLMEQQSRTFLGAMSNIKDALLQVSATAFEPLFKKISEITDRIAQELQNGKPTLESVTRSITVGLIEIIATAGAQAGESFIESTAKKIGDPSAWKRLLSNISGATLLDPLLRGLFSVDPEDLFGLGDVDIPSIKVPDLKTPLAGLKEQQTEVSEATKKAADLVNDLALKLAFYGQNTEAAATKQKLFSIGMEALASAEGRRAVQLAELIDKQKLSAELNERQRKFSEDLAAVTEGKYKNAFETLTSAQDDARISILDLGAAETGGLSAIDRFNLGLGAQVEGLLATVQASVFTKEQINILRISLQNARVAMAELTAAQEENKRRLDLKAATESLTQFLKQQAETLRSLRFGPKTALQEVEEFIAQFPKWTGAMKETETFSESFWLRFNAHIIDSTRRMKEMLDLMRESAGSIPAPGHEVPGGVPTIPIDVGLPPPSDVDVFAEAIKHLKGVMEDFSSFTSETFVFAIDSLTDGIREAARAWIIYGESIGKALRRALAETFATISAEALIQALLHAAYALGNLAFGNFAAAAKHGIAAAKFAAVAAAAGIAGRVTAGSAFSSSGVGSSGGGSTGSGSGASTTTQQPKPVNLDRDTNRAVYLQPIVNVTVTGQATEGFKYMVEKASTDSYRDGGALNNIVRHAMGDPGFQV